MLIQMARVADSLSLSSVIRARTFPPAKGRRRQSGFTLAELLAVLGVVAVIIVIGSLIYNQVNQSLRSNMGRNQLNNLVAGIRETFGGSNYTAGALNTTLVNYQAVPADMIQGGAIYNTFGGAVTVTGATSTFTVQFAGVPQTACARLVSVGGGGGGFVSVQVNGGTVRTPPVTQATAFSDCSSASSNTILWTYN